MPLPLKPEKLIYFLLLGVAAALLPFFALAFFCHPSGDDFWLTNMAMEIGIWPAQWEIRQTWSGRYISMFLTAINPLVFRSFLGYQLTAILAFGLFLLGAKFFFHSLFPQKPARMIWLLAGLLLALYVGFMPVVAQTFYWISGTINYQFAHVALLFLLGLVVRRGQQPASPARNSGWMLFLIFFIAGSNETIMAGLFYLVVGALFFEFRLHRKISGQSWLLLAWVAACCAVVILAPGNALRGAQYPQQGRLLTAIFYAAVVPVNNSLNWLSAGPVLVLTLLFLPFCAGTAGWPARWVRIHPVLGWLFLYGALAACFFVSYYSKGDHAPPRVQDTIYLVFLLGWFLNVRHTVAYLEAREWPLPALPTYAVVVLWVTLLLWLFQNRQSHIRTAYQDLFSGRAARYDQEMRARYDLLRRSDCQVCEIPAVKNMPATIFFEEIPADTTWKNRYFSAYFGKKLMLLK